MLTHTDSTEMDLTSQWMSTPRAGVLSVAIVRGLCRDAIYRMCCNYWISPTLIKLALALRITVVPWDNTGAIKRWIRWLRPIKRALTIWDGKSGLDAGTRSGWKECQIVWREGPRDLLSVCKRGGLWGHDFPPKNAPEFVWWVVQDIRLPLYLLSAKTCPSPRYLSAQST